MSGVGDPTHGIEKKEKAVKDQFVVVDCDGEIIAEFCDSDSAESHRDALRTMPSMQYVGLEVKAMCLECGRHVEEDDGVCTAWTPPVYDRSIGTLRKVIAALRGGSSAA